MMLSTMIRLICGRQIILFRENDEIKVLMNVNKSFKALTQLSRRPKINLLLNATTELNYLRK